MSNSQLQSQFFKILAENTFLSRWLVQERVDGIWFSSWDKPKDFWMNEGFLHSLTFSSEKDTTHITCIEEITDDLGKDQIKKLIHSAKEKPTESCCKTLNFKNKWGDKVTMQAEVFAVVNTGFIFKFRIAKISKSKKYQDLKDEIKRLEKLESVYNETNEIARIGGWDVDLVKNEITWTNVTCDIHEVSRDYKPDLSTGISFYKEGSSRDLITKLFADAVEKKLSFDDEFKLVTAKGNEIWVRSFGKPEFKEGKCVRVYGAFQDIDEQKKRQIELKMAKDRFKSIFDNAPVGTILFDVSDNILAVNPSSRDIFGFENYSEAEIANLTFKDFIKPDYIENFYEHKNNLYTEKNTKHKIELQCMHSSGKTIWCNMISALMPGENTSDKLVITKIQDITEQKELQHQAEVSANRFIKAFENSPNGMGVVSTTGDWVMINNNLAQMVGYTKDEFLELHFWNITHHEDKNSDALDIENIFKKKIDHYTTIKRYIHKDGRIVYCQLHVSAIYDQQAKVKSLIFQVVDITEQLKAQNDLKLTLNDLQGLLDATTQIIIIETDLQHVIRKFNKGAERMLGYKAEEVVGKERPGLFHVKSEIDKKRELLSTAHNVKIKSKDIFTYNLDAETTEPQEWTYKRKDGSEFTVQLVVTAVRNQEYDITGYLGIATDISELKAMEESLISAKERAEMASESKSEFLANMSHEIRTPLNGVIGFTDLLMRTELNESQKNYMQTVYNSANSLLDLINDILDFSKIEAGKLELHEEKVDVIDLCEQTIDLFRHQAHKKGLEILLNISPELERFICADSIRLRQIVMNLIGNAIKFTQQGEIEFKIIAQNAGEDPGMKTFTFSVRDTGIGIAPQNLHKIFYAFDQEDASTTRRFGGTGLGLTISNRLLELMDSKLKVKSTLGGGSIFYFDVEFKVDTTGSVTKKPLRDVNKVLIVDDNTNNRTIINEMLTSKGIETIEVLNGIEAMDILEENNDFDLAIIDYHMPYLNGLELIKFIRKDLNITKEDLPILLLHSSGEDDIINKKCKDYDVQFFRTKPIHITDLFNLINQIEYPGKDKKCDSLAIPDIQTDLSAYTFNILVAEDNPVNKHLTRTILRKLMPDLNLIEVDNGEEAVTAYKENQVDLILMDIQMPVLSGFEATEKIRDLEKKTGAIPVPIVALTAKTVKGERERCLGYGMDDYVTKPVIMQTLKKVILKQLVNTSDKEHQMAPQPQTQPN